MSATVAVGTHLAFGALHDEEPLTLLHRTEVVVAIPPKRDSHAPRDQQSELLRATAGSAEPGASDRVGRPVGWRRTYALG